MCRWNGKALIQRDIDLVIDSDASLEGWGARCPKQRTGGPWSQQECSMHINCLELLAATLAVKTFAKAKTAMSILLRIDNTTAVAYISRRDSLQGISDPHKRSMDVVPQKEYSHCSSAPTRCIEYTSPYIVQANAGQDRLEVQPCDIPENQQPFWAPGHGPVCVQTVHPVPTLLQLAATSLFIGNRCISSGLDSHEILCESSVESGGLGSCTSAITTSSSGASSSCLEDTTLVPDASEHADRPSPVDNTDSKDAYN